MVRFTSLAKFLSAFSVPVVYRFVLNYFFLSDKYSFDFSDYFQVTGKHIEKCQYIRGDSHNPLNNLVDVFNKIYGVFKVFYPFSQLAIEVCKNISKSCRSIVILLGSSCKYISRCIQQMLISARRIYRT